MKKYKIILTTEVDAPCPHLALQEIKRAVFDAKVTPADRLDSVATHETYNQFVRDTIGKEVVSVLEHDGDGYDVMTVYQKLTEDFKLPITLRNHQA